jgi:hypothetical protein
MILTEPLFVVLLCVHLACVLHLLRGFSLSSAIAAGLAMGAAILVRPAGYSLIACIPALGLLAVGHRRAAVVGMGVPAIALLLLASASNYSRYGMFATQSYGGLSLVGHVAHLIRADMPTSEPELAARIDAATAETRRGLDELSVPHAHWFGMMNLYNVLLWRDVYPVLAHEAERRLPGSSLDLRNAEISRLAGVLAVDAIRNAPLAYAKHVVSNYYGMWAVTLVPYGTLSAHARECFDSTRAILAASPAAFERGLTATIYEEPRTVARFMQETGQFRLLDFVWFALTALQLPLVVSALAVSLAGVAVAAWADRLTPAERGLSYAGIALQGYFALVVGVQAAIPRYAVVMEPYALLLVLGGALVACGRWQGKRQTG